MNKISIKKVASVTGLFLGAFALSVLAADWTPAPCVAPACNTDAPLNVGTSAQRKIGNLVFENTLSIGKDSFASAGYNLDVDGPGFFSGGLIVGGLTNTNSLKVTSPGFETAGNVLTTDGAGLAEWKPATTTAGVALQGVVKEFTLLVPRKVTNTSLVTDTSYLFCALTRLDAEMGRVNAGSVSQAYCQVTKNNDGKWTLGAYLADDPDFTCRMTCLK